MTLTLSVDPDETLVVSLREGDSHTSVSARPARAAAASLVRALDDAVDAEYGECFWPGADGGQYWWMFKRTNEAVEVVALWTRGGVAIWEHVFRATDSFDWVRERLGSELSRMGLPGPTASAPM